MIKILNSIMSTPARTPPTSQQKGVVDAMQSGQDNVCVAFAGSGKTATGIEVAHELELPGYLLLFNRAARNNASARLPPGVAAITGHALAFAHVIESSDRYQQKLAGTLNPDDGAPLNGMAVAQALRLTNRSDPDIPAVNQLATAILKTIEAFQVSAADRPDPDHVPKDVIPLQLRQPEFSDEVNALQARIADHAKALWKRMASEHSPVPINHDTYLKLFQLRKQDLRAPLWILDEYQDTNPVVEALINQQSGQRLSIGDPYQAIYGWRGAINAMAEPIRRGINTHYLTDSFRYNHQIAGMATMLLRSLGEKVPVRGQPRDLHPVNTRDKHTVICRTNLTILFRAGELLMRGHPVYVDGGMPWAPYKRLLSAMALYENRIDDVKVGLLKQLGSWPALVEFARSPAASPDIMTLIQMVEQYGPHLPVLLDRLKNQLPWKNPRAQGQTTLITAHRSKGRQFLQVELDDDLALPDNLMNKLKSQAPLTLQERETVHVLYVALTRAELAILLPRGIKRNFRELHQTFASADDTINTFTAETVVPLTGGVEKADRAARTAEFIRQHRKNS